MPPIELTPIGHIRTPFEHLEACPHAVGADTQPCRIELFPAVADGLLGIEAASHLWLLYWLHQADRNRLTSLTPHDGVHRGVFASRSPGRPNPIGLKAVRLHGVALGDRRPTLIIGGMDCLDGTPLLDIKPYMPMADRH